MNTTSRLLDWIDCTLLQYLQNVLSASIGTAVVMVDPQGKAVTTLSAWSSPQELGHPREASATPCPPPRPELTPAAVMIFSADAFLGQVIVGDAMPQTAPPDVESLIFMPLENDLETVGFLGFAQGTIRDWPPEALAHFQTLARELSGHFAENTTMAAWGFSSRFRPVYKRPASRPPLSA